MSRVRSQQVVALAWAAWVAWASAGWAQSNGVEAEIRAFDEQFVKAFEAGDPKEVAAFFTEDAEVFEADGARYQGRDLIEQSYAEVFAVRRGAKLKLEIASIRSITPDVVKEEGRSTVGLETGEISERFYTALLVRRDGRWRIASIREESIPVVRAAEALGELDWMIGEWVDSGEDSETRVECKRSPDGNFLLRDFTVKQGGKVVLQVWQRVGWDPVARIFRSWQFDSEGGFGEGTWSRDGDRWVVKEAGVRPEGVTASATRTLARLSPDLVRWIQTDLVVNGEILPGERTSVLTRVPPPPQQIEGAESGAGEAAKTGGSDEGGNL